MTPEEVKNSRVEVCSTAIQAEWSDSAEPCDWKVDLRFPYNDFRMCRKHETHWEAYYGSCWALELRMLKARAQVISGPFVAAIIEEAELVKERVWQDYAQTRDYRATKAQFEAGINKAEELVDRLEIRARLGWPRTGDAEMSRASEHSDPQTLQPGAQQKPRRRRSSV